MMFKKDYELKPYFAEFKNHNFFLCQMTRKQKEEMT